MPPRRFENPSEAVYRYLLKTLSHNSLQKVEIMLPSYLQATENKSHLFYLIPNIWQLSSEISSRLLYWVEDELVSMGEN